MTYLPALYNYIIIIIIIINIIIIIIIDQGSDGPWKCWEILENQWKSLKILEFSCLILYLAQTVI